MLRSWTDETQEGVAQLAGDAVGTAPYVKVKLVPIVKFKDPITYNDYLSQQSMFLYLEGRRDVCMDQYTTIESKFSGPIKQLVLLIFFYSP
jgi:hypothetical protein